MIVCQNIYLLYYSCPLEKIIIYFLLPGNVTLMICLRDWLSDWLTDWLTGLFQRFALRSDLVDSSLHYGVGIMFLISGKLMIDIVD